MSYVRTVNLTISILLSYETTVGLWTTDTTISTPALFGRTHTDDDYVEEDGTVAVAVDMAVCSWWRNVDQHMMMEHKLLSLHWYDTNHSIVPIIT